MARLFLLLVFMVSPLWAHALTAEEVVSSSMKHYPKVVESVLKVSETEQKLRSARGQFDAKVKGDVDARTEGYYNGDAYKVQVAKPIPYFNSEVYGGMRQSYGDFPGYEGKSVTLSDGEFFAGVSISLLRDSLIDQRRFKIRSGTQDLEINKNKLEQVKLQVQTMALQAYWNWVVSGYRLKVFTNILKLAETRAGQIARRIRVGDLARIYQSENDQYIAKRQADVQKSEANFANAGYYLSLFYRNTEGQVQLPKNDELPSIKGLNLPGDFLEESLTNMALKRSLEIRMLQAERVKADLTRRMGQNEILPKVDLRVEWNQDQTQSAVPVNQDENRIMLAMEIPIEYRKGLGLKRAGEAARDQVDTKLRFAQDKIRAKARQLTVKANALSEVFKLTERQVNLADILARAERRKFKQGASDLLRVNIREETLAEAQVKNLQSLLDYQLTRADIRFLTIDFLVQ